MSGPERLGKNLGAYFGERIDVHSTLREIAIVAGRHGWALDKIPTTAGLNLLALRRTRPGAERRVYISAGIHGDEPAGPLAVLQLLKENRWPDDTDLWLCPCLNPTGFERNTRENAAGVDLNRDYREPGSPEVQAHVRWLQAQPRFQRAICLHEDWESRGFYVYERNPLPRASLAPRIVAAVAPLCPIDTSPEIDGWPAHDGIIDADDPPDARPQWAEAIYLTRHCADQACTLEAPSDFALPTRIAALVTGVSAALE